MTVLVERNTTIPATKTETFSHGGRQPDGGDGPGVPGRTADGRRQPAARPVQPGRHPARAARHAADRSHVRHRRQRHPQRDGQGQGHRQGAQGRDRAVERAVEGRDREDAEGRRVARRRGQARSASWPKPATRRSTSSTRPRRCSRSTPTSSTPARSRPSRRAVDEGPRSGEGGRRGRDQVGASKTWSRRPTRCRSTCTTRPSRPEQHPARRATVSRPAVPGMM